MIDWTHWHNEPFLVGGIVWMGWMYALLVGPLRRFIAPDAPYPVGHSVRFYSACVVFYLAVGSPLDQIGERFLLSAHMVQHQLLIYVAAVLMLTGIPTWLADRALGGRVLRWPLRIFLHPLVAAVGYSLVISVWHAPALYDWALRDKNVHVIEHLMFFGAALWYWWPIISPATVHPPISRAMQMIYLVCVTILMTPLFAFIAFSENVLYPTYEYAPRIIAGFSPENDQLMGAAIMKLGGLMVTFITLVVVFYDWYQQSEGAGRRRRMTARGAA